MIKKYTLEYLKSLLEKDKAKLVGEYKNMNVYTIINYICNCGNNHNKKFIVLEKHNAYCSDCSKKNSNNLNSIIKKEQSNKYWENIRIINKLTCRICNCEKPLNDFNKLGERWEKECTACNKNRKTREVYNRLENGSLEYNLQHLMKGITRRTKDNNDERLNINLEYLKEIYNEQKGFCKYSGRTMTFKIHCLNHISVDRIDNTKWYEKGNIALCCSFVNKMKNDITLDEFKLFIKDINNTLNY